MRELTRAEEQIMQELWKIGKGFVNDVLEKLQEPKPAYNTVSTIIRILEKKGFVGHNSYGKSHEYYPIVSQDEYRRFVSKSLLKNYFSNSVNQLVSHFSREQNIDLKELEEIKAMIELQIEEQKNKTK